MYDAIVSAIREAEDDAYERAAQDAEWCAIDADESGAPVCAKAYRYLRDRVRSLKSKETGR